MRWLRLWTDALDSKKLLRLPPDLFRAWTLLLLSTARSGSAEGNLPTIKDLAFDLREEPDTVAQWIASLVAVSLIDIEGNGYRVHDWKRWQPIDRTRAERQGRYRDNHPDAKSNAPSNGSRNGESNGPCNGDRRQKAEGRVKDTPPTPVAGGAVCGSRSSDEEEPEPFQSPIPEPPKTDPDVARVADLAADAFGNISWSTWVCQRARLGDSPALIEAAIREAVDSKAKAPGPKYVAAIIARLKVDGVPERPATIPIAPTRTPEQQAAVEAKAAEKMKKVIADHEAYTRRIEAERRANAQAR